MYQVLKCKQTLTSLDGVAACEIYGPLNSLDSSSWFILLANSVTEGPKRYMESSVEDTAWDTQKNLILDMVACNSDNEKCNNGSIAVT